MTRVLILSRHAEDYRAVLERAGLPGLELGAAVNAVQAGKLRSDFEIVFGEPSLIRLILMNLPELRWVQSMYAGVEQLLDPALRRDYVLTNARGVFGSLMSEYVFGYLLAHERRIFERYQAQRERRWDGSTTGMLRGRTVGLLGVGSIGAELAHTAKHFGMKVRGYTRSSEGCPDVDAYYHGEQRERLLEFANNLDYLVTILPNTPGTRRIVDGALLNSLPAHALLVNVGRGSTLDEPALIEALKAGKIAGAVLDVFQEEPLPKDHPFWATPHLLLTFHTSAPSLPEDIAGLFVQNYQRYRQGQELLYRVDFERGY